MKNIYRLSLLIHPLFLASLHIFFSFSIASCVVRDVAKLSIELTNCLMHCIYSLWISKKRNWFPKTDPMHWSFSTFSTNNPSDWFAFFHYALKHLMMQSHRHDILITCLLFKLIYYTCLTLVLKILIISTVFWTVSLILTIFLTI